jgi:hypothetical protein
MVGDVEVIIFVGTKLGALNYYGIMDNHLRPPPPRGGRGAPPPTPLTIVFDFQFLD